MNSEVVICKQIVKQFVNYIQIIKMMINKKNVEKY